MGTDEAFPAREKNPADLAKLEGYNPKMVETSCAKVAGPDRRAGKANEAWALYKWNPFRVSWGDLSNDLCVNNAQS